MPPLEEGIAPLEAEALEEDELEGEELEDVELEDEEGLGIDELFEGELGGAGIDGLAEGELGGVGIDGLDGEELDGELGAGGLLLEELDVVSQPASRAVRQNIPVESSLI